MLGRFSSFRSLFSLKLHGLKVDPTKLFLLKENPSRSFFLRSVSSLGLLSKRTIVLGCISASAAYIQLGSDEIEDDEHENGEIFLGSVPNDDGPSADNAGNMSSYDIEQFHDARLCVGISLETSVACAR